MPTALGFKKKAFYCAQYLAEVNGHRCLVSADGLTMHLALVSGVRYVSILTCTIRWETYEASGIDRISTQGNKMRIGGILSRSTLSRPGCQMDAPRT